MRSFRAATLIYDGTVAFCDRFLDKRTRMVDQMVQAARSGRQNIAEGSRASAGTSQTELRLVTVARASLDELPARPADRRAGASFCRGRRLQRAISSGAHRRAAATAAASLNARSGFPGLPALRRAHGPPHGAQRRSGRVAVLGMHRLPGMPWNPAGGRIGRIAPIGRIARIHSDVIACPRGRIGNCDCEFPGSCAR